MLRKFFLLLIICFVLFADTHSTTETTELPDSWDWRNVDGKDYTTPVKDQGVSYCDCCWAFSTIFSLESALEIYHDKPEWNIDLSEQMLISDCLTESGCSYYDMDATMNFMTYSFIPLETCFGYTLSRFFCDPCYWREETYCSSDYEVFNGADLPSEERIQTIKEMIIESPVLANVASLILYGYRGGIVDHPDRPGDRCLAIIGYKDVDDERYWICRYSFGPDWGEDGYIRIQFDSRLEDIIYRPIYSYLVNREIDNVYPIHNAHISNCSKLKWSIEKADSGLHFEILIDNDYDFSSPITISSLDSIAGFSPLIPTIANSGDYSYIIGSRDEHLASGIYWWRVRAVKGRTRSLWGEVTSFIIDDSIEYEGWYQTSDEQFEENEVSDIAITFYDNSMNKKYIGEIFHDDFDYSDAEEFYDAWHVHDGSDSLLIGEDSMITIELSDYMDSLRIYDGDRYLQIRDSSYEEAGFVSYRFDSVETARISIWFNFTDTLKYINILSVHHDSETSIDNLVGQLFLEYFRYEGAILAFNIFDYDFFIPGYNHSEYINNWNKYTLEIDCNKHFVSEEIASGLRSFPGTAKIFVNDTLIHSWGVVKDYLNQVSFGTNLLGDGLHNAGIYNNFSVRGLEDSIATVTTQPIVKPSYSYWSTLVYNKTPDSMIDVLVQKRVDGEWINHDSLYSPDSHCEFNISGLGLVDTIRLVGIFTSMSDTTIKLFDWGVYWTEEPDTLTDYYKAVYPGWNLLSSISESTEPVSIWGTTPFEYDAISRAYDSSDSLREGKGYFALYTERDSIPMLFGLDEYSIDIHSGWNLIGSIDTPIPVDSITSSPPDILISPLYYWNTRTSSYQPSDTIYPGNGYWLLSIENGVLEVF